MKDLIPSDAKILVSKYLPTMKNVQFKFPRSKKKRIKKKWSNQEKNFKYISCEDDIYRLEGNIFLVSPRIYELIKAKVL